jgi:hypothetical protein
LPGLGKQVEIRRMFVPEGEKERSFSETQNILLIDALYS